MRYKLPSLNALRAFEAAARHANISRAGEELCVSPGAVSRHIAILESHFDCRLFVREQRGVIPTEIGQRYLREITAAFVQIDRASRNVRLNKTAPTLKVRLFTTLSSDWLSCRIGAFRLAYPDVHLSLSASLQPPDFDSGDVDIGMMFGPGDWPDLHCDVLFRGSFTPVCTPTLGSTLRRPADLRQHNLLYSPLQVARWDEWLSQAGVEQINTDEGLRFESSSHAYHAARHDAGVALGQSFFLIDDLRSGRLLAPFDLKVYHPLSYCLVCLRKRVDEPAIAAFRSWLVEQVHQTDREASAPFAPACGGQVMPGAAPAGLPQLADG